MASLGMQIWTALEYGFKRDEQLIKNINKAHNNYLTDHSKDNKLKLWKLILESYAKLYDTDIESQFKPKVESRKGKEYSELVSEIIMVIVTSCEKDRLEDYVRNYEPEKSKDRSFLLFFHSKHSIDFDHIAGRYDKKTKSNGMRGGKDAVRVEAEINEEGKEIDPLDIIADDEKYIPGSEESEGYRKDNAITAIRKYSEVLEAIKISDDKKKIFAVNVTYDALAGSYKKDSPDIGKTSFLRSITNDYRKLKAAFVQASDEAFEMIITVARSEKRFPTKGDLAKHIGKDQGYMKRCCDDVKKKIKEYE